MAVEAMFPLDLLMDVCILSAVQLALDRPCLKRLLRAILLLQLMTVFSILLPAARAAMPLALALAAHALLGRRSIRAVIEAGLALFCGYAACAGFLSLSGRRMATTLSGLLFFCVLLYRRRHIRSQWNIEVILEYKGRQRCFTALIDTGNRLKEHLSGLPVFIVEEATLGRTIEDIHPDSCISIPYGVLGSSGEILCFRPDKLSIMRDDGSSTAAPECLVGIFPSRIPGSTHALAPPEFAQCTASRPPFPISHIKSSRRYSHGVFKHKAIHLWPGGSNPQRFSMLHRRQ